MTDSKPSRAPIAVVGVSALFPGSLEETGFWRDILQGSDLMTDVPASHWLIEDYYDPDPSVPDKTYAKRGAFLKDIDFDAMAWGIPPNIVPETDTSQLLALIVAQRVLAEACQGSIEDADRSRTSVILGVTSGQELLGSMVSRLQRPIWVKALRETGLPEDEVQAACDRISDNYTPWNESTFPGLLGNVVAGRIANRLDLGGTNCVTDAACASTFSALQMAVNELYLGDSDVVISGGVDTMNDIFMFMCFSKTPALSPTGDCRPFSDQADGTMLGEGIGMVALKRLADAERDDDRIYCVINAVASSSDGRAKSVYAPRPEGQSEALRRAYAIAGFGPETVELLEAHGTGTPAGDAAEFKGLATVFADSGREDAQWCALGSVKSQIGHTKAAAGAAGLFKAVMSLHHKVLPPTIKIDQPNPNLEIETSPFNLTTRSRPWVRNSQHPRRASVSSFGFGGSNFHLALSEYAPAIHGESAGRRAARLRAQGCELVVLSGASGADVAAQARTSADDASKAGFLIWLARSTQARFDNLAPARLALVANDEADLANKLVQAADRIEAGPEQAFSTPTGIHYGVGRDDDAGLAFLFSGQGSQYLDMGASLAMHFDAAMSAWDAAAEFEWDGATRLHNVVFPNTAFDDATALGQGQTLAATQWAQPAIGCTSLAQLAMLSELGIEADCHAGHSFGEVTALHAAGVYSREDFLRIARKRGELMNRAAVTPGAMLALSEPIERVRTLLEGIDTSVVIANHNAPEQVVLSGETSAIEIIEAKLAEEGVKGRRLPVATAFHSPVVAEASGAFGSFLEEVSFDTPKAPVYSNTSGTVHAAEGAALRSNLAKQLANPVKFVDMIEAIYASGARHFVEVGPGSVLTGLVGRILGERDHLAINLDRKGRDGVQSFFEGLAVLAAAGREFAFEALWSGYADPANPNDRVEPKLTLPISGSNYGKPYPPLGGASERPAPNPPRPPAEVRPSAPAPAAVPAAAPAPAQPAVPASAIASPTAQSAVRTAASPQSGFVSTAAAPPAATASFANDPAWIQAHQEAQRQTAEAHSMYLQAMAQTHTAYLDSIERTMQAMTPGVATAVTAPVLNAPPVAPVQAQVSAAPSVSAPAVASPQEIVSAAPVPVPPIATTPIVASPAPPASNIDLHALLLEVVSEKTGYPPEMLTSEMELEGDLGIDSIKRVEILAAMNEKVPALPEVDMATMAKLATLGEVVDYMNGLLGGTGAAPATSAAGVAAPVADAASEIAPGASLGRFTLEALERPAVGLALAGLYGSGPIAVTREGSELAEAVVAALATRGVEAVSVDVADLANCNSSGVVFLGGLRQTATDKEAIAINREAFAVARAVAPRFSEAPAHSGIFVSVQDTGGAFGTTEFEPRQAWLAGLAGLTRTVSQEWPGISAKAIDLERAGRADDALADTIANELCAGGADLDVGLDAAGRRVVLHSERVEVVPGTPVLADGDVVLAAGGARGVTATNMIALAGEAQLRFALLGRTPLADEPPGCIGIEGDAALKRELLAQTVARGEKLTPAELGKQVAGILAAREVRATMTAIEKAGSQVRYVAADVTNADDLRVALADVREAWGEVAAIVHGAGVIADKVVAEKTDDQFDRVFDTKVEGLRALLAATAEAPIKLLCFFSSVAARCGNLGQCDYAMANEILNKVAAAEARRRGGVCLVKSLGWGPWEGGMVSPQLKAHFESLGVPLIPLAAGARMLVEEVRGSAPEQIELVLGGEPRPEVLNPAEPGRAYTLEVSVDRNSHPYLSDHAIKGTPVVPVAMAIEWMSRAARAFSAKLSLGRLVDLKVLRGISLQDFSAGRKRLFVHCRQLTNGQGATLALEIGDDAGAIHYHCTAEMVEGRLPESQSDAAAADSDLGLEAWGDRVIYDGDLLFHGPDFQMIRSIDGISNDGMVAQLAGVSEVDWRAGTLSEGRASSTESGSGANGGAEPWSTDPRALDGGLQMALVWCQHVLGGASLPTGIGEIRNFVETPASGSIRCTLIGRSASGQKSVSDLVFRDEAGRLLAALSNVETHLLPNSTSTSARG